MKNSQIYEYGQKLSVFNGCNIKMPVRINFYLQKNIQIIQQACADIERARMSVIEQFGILSEDGTKYNIPDEMIEPINQEISDLLELDQDLAIHKFKLSDFDGIELTYQQMSAIMFMIEED